MTCTGIYVLYQCINVIDSIVQYSINLTSLLGCVIICSIKLNSPTAGFLLFVVCILITLCLSCVHPYMLDDHFKSLNSECPRI